MIIIMRLINSTEERIISTLCATVVGIARWQWQRLLSEKTRRRISIESRRS